MGERSAIEWTDHTFNPWWGCTKVSDACKFCYAEAFAKRTGHAVWGDAAPRRFFADEHWEEPKKWDRDAARDGVRRKVFCASMADVFEEREDLIEPRARLIRLIEQTHHLDWLLLTKRPEHAARLSSQAGWSLGGWPDNAWCGSTLETTKEFGRVLSLAPVPSRFRFLSCEPLLGSLNDAPLWTRRDLPSAHNIEWIIAGGESGPGARPMHPTWPKELLVRAQQDGVAYFFKQWGDWEPMMTARSWVDGILEMERADWKEMLSGTCIVGYDGKVRFPERPYESWLVREGERLADEEDTFSDPMLSVAMHRVGKKTAGRVLDGRTWDEFPDGPTGPHDWQPEIIPAVEGRPERRRQRCAGCDLSISLRAMTAGRCQPRLTTKRPRQLEILS